MKCYQAKEGELQKSWYVIDATDMVVGRLAAQIAPILMGKHRPTYTPHIDTGDYVIVTNVDKVVFTGNKWQQKSYQRYTGHPGGQKAREGGLTRCHQQGGPGDGLRRHARAGRLRPLIEEPGRHQRGAQQHAAPGEAHTQPLPPLFQAIFHGGQCPAETAGGLVPRPALQAAQDDGRPVLLGKPVQFLVEDGLELPHG